MTISSTATDGLAPPQRYWAIAAVWLAIIMAVLDGAIANVALPTIGRELHATPAASIWIVNAYQLAITVSLLPAASLGDVVGYKRVYLAGLAIFTGASVACALSGSLVGLSAARVAQGVGAAGIMAINGAMVRFIFPRAGLGRAIGLNAVVVSLAAAAGPTVASSLLSVAPWPALFAVNVPIGLVALVIGLKALPVTPRAMRRFDFLSAGLNAVTFGFLILGAETMARQGAAAGAAIVVVGAVAGIFLLRRELSMAEPLVPLDLLRIPVFRLSVLTSIASFAAQMLAFVALPFYLQGALGRSVIETGLLMTAWPLSIGAMAPIAGRLADRYPAGKLGAVGLAMMAAGLALLAVLPPDASNPDIVWRTILCGLGFGFFQSPNNRTLMSSAPRHRSGAAGGMLATARLLGQTIGATSMAVLFHLAPDGATKTGLFIAAVIALAAAALSSLRRGRRGAIPLEDPGAEQEMA